MAAAVHTPAQVDVFQTHQAVRPVAAVFFANSEHPCQTECPGEGRVE